MGYLLINSGRVTSTSDPNTVSTSRPPAANKLVPHVKTKPGTPYAGKLRFPSSDGDSNRWPTINTSVAPDDTHDFFRIDDFEANKKLSPMEQKHREEIVLKWKEKIGTYLGNKLKQTNGYRYILRDFPEGYALFEQKRITNPDRRDPYLYGSSTVLSFRSPEEFYDHAEWLILMCPTPCICQYCDPNNPRRKNKKKEASHDGVHNSSPGLEL